MNFLLALLPIAIIVVGMAGFNYPSKVVAPISWIVALFFGNVVFKTPLMNLAQTSWNGFLDGVRIVWLIFAAFTLLIVMVDSTAMDSIKRGLSKVTRDKRLMVLFLAIPFGTFLEGAAGAGAPAALAAPFLVGLGMNPVIAAAACLIGNSCPVSWGGAGVTTVVGAGAAGLDFVPVSVMTGKMMSLGYILLPILIIGFVFGKKAFRGIWKDVLVMGFVMGSINFTMSNVFIPVTELTSLIGGMAGTFVFGAYLWLRKNASVPQEYAFSSPDNDEMLQNPRFSFLRSLLPYFILSILLVVVRLSFSLKTLVSFGGGYTVWVGCVVLTSAFLASILLGYSKFFLASALKAFKRVIPALISMGLLLAMVNCMKLSGQISTLAVTFATIGSLFYPAVAVLIGQIGSFVTGTNLGSNLMFNPLHVEAAKNLSINVLPVVAAQNTGGAIGNMICPNNVVAVCACVAILGREGEVMRKTLLPSICFLFFFGFLAMVYTYVIFPA